MRTSGALSVDQLAIDTIRTLAMDAVETAKPGHPDTRMTELLEEADQAYRAFVLLPSVRARVSVEAASPIGWDRYVETTGARIAMVSFGGAAPYKDLFRHFGFTAAQVLAASKQQIEQHKEIKREPADSVA